MNPIRAKVQARIAEQLRKSPIPDHMKESFREYLINGVPVGHFLTALLCGNLFETYARADEDNQKHVYDYVFFLYNYAPAGAFGDTERVEEWIKHKGLAYLDDETTTEDTVTL